MKIEGQGMQIEKVWTYVRESKSVFDVWRYSDTIISQENILQEYVMNARREKSKR